MSITSTITITSTMYAIAIKPDLNSNTPVGKDSNAINAPTNISTKQIKTNTIIGLNKKSNRLKLLNVILILTFFVVVKKIID